MCLSLPPKWFTDGDHEWGLPSGQTQDYFKNLVAIYAAPKDLLYILLYCIYGDP